MEASDPMRNPMFWRTVELGWAASGVLAVLAAFWLPDGLAADWIRTTLFAYGLTAVIFGSASALWSHQGARAQDALLRGDDLIARWRVDAATWRAFIARNGELNQAPGALVNALSVRDAIPDNGVEIIVGRDAIQIDDSIHQVPARGTPEVTHAELISDRPDYVELQLLYPGGGHGASGVPRGPTRMVLRFPVTSKSWHDARAVIAHYSGLSPQKADFFHGKGDGSDPEDLNTCAKCGFQMYRYASRCPKCGGSMATRRWARRFGRILVLCGLFISGVMGAVVYYTAPLLLHPGSTIGGTRFSGTRAQSLSVMSVFALVLAFGLTALCYGIWQVQTGRRNRRVAVGFLALWSVLLVIAGAL